MSRCYDWDCFDTHQRCFAAVERGDTDTVRRIVREGFDANVPDHILRYMPKFGDDEKNTSYGFLLHTAVYLNNADMVGLLLNMHANVNREDWCRETPLHVVARTGNMQIAEMLIAVPAANMDAAGASGKTPVHYAVERGHVHIVRIFIDKLSDVNMTTTQGVNLLYLAVQKNRLDIVQVLLAKNANANVVVGHRTPLHLAADNNLFDMVLTLLRGGADVNFIVEDVDTPLHRACAHGNLRMVKALLAHGANLSACDYFNQTPLCIAIQNECVDITRELLARGANVNIHSSYGETMLHKAARWGDSDIFELILDKSIDINAKNENDYTALHIAVSRANMGVADLLLKKGARVDCMTDTGHTALHFALQMRVDLVKPLITIQPDLNSVTGCATALEEAASIGRLDVVKLLLEFHPVQHKVYTDWEIVHIELFNGNNMEILYREIEEHEKNHMNTLSPVHYGLFLKKTDMTMAMLEHCAFIDRPDENGRTLLHYAVFCRETPVVELLLTRGACINRADVFGQTAIMMAMNSDNAEVVHKLLTHKCEIPRDLFQFLDHRPRIRGVFGALFWVQFMFLIPSNAEDKHGRAEAKVVVHRDTSNKVMCVCTGFSSQSVENLRRYFARRMPSAAGLEPEKLL